MAKGGLEADLVVSKFYEVDFEDAEGFDVSEVGEPFENAFILGFVRWRVAQPPDVRRQDFSSFFRDVLAPPLELRFVLKSDVMEEMALALRKPRFRNEGAGFERSAEVTVG